MKLSLSLAIICVPLSALGTLSIKTENYRGWEGSYRMSNGVVELVVVPQIGRVMHYGEVRSTNLLWENLALGPSDSSKPGYDNFGGDKLWYAPQKLWNWPPDSGIDGSPHKVEVLKDGLRMTSEVGKIFPLQFVREIKMKDFGNEVRFTNKMFNKGRECEVSIWQVTQINNPSRVELPTELSTGYKVLIGDKIDPAFHKVERGKLLITRSPKRAFKFGSRSSEAKLTAVIDRTTFESSSTFVRKGVYPDGNSSLEIYTNGDPDKYVELEHLSPLLRLGTREVAIQQVTWRIKNGR